VTDMDEPGPKTGAASGCTMGSRELRGALWLGVMLVLAAATQGFWSRLWPDAPQEEECLSHCIYVQVRGLERGEGVYRLSRFTALGDFLERLGVSGHGPERDRILEDWTSLDFPDSTGRLAPGVKPMGESSRFLLGQPMDLNRAGIRDLLLLPGIGPGLARRIVQDRRRNGPFRSPEDLSRVKGIPGKTLEIVKPMVSAGGSGNWH
jgi:competence protein ComEA